MTWTHDMKRWIARRVFVPILRACVAGRFGRAVQTVAVEELRRADHVAR